MKRIKIVGLCLIAAFAFSAVAAGSAFASSRPEFKLCAATVKVEKKYSGSYSDKGCTVEAVGGKYEREEVAEGTAFTGKSKESKFTIAGKTVTCKKDAVSGSIFSQFAAHEKIVFSSCTDEKKEPCGNVASNTIETDQLVNELYFLDEAETEAGVALSGEEGVFAEFKCGAETITIEGFALGAASSGKKGVTSTFAVSGGHQAVQGIWLSGHQLEAHLVESEGNEVTLETTETVKAAVKGVGVFS